MGERPEAIFLPAIIIGMAAFCKMNFSYLLRLNLTDIPAWCLIKLGFVDASLLHVFLKKNNFQGPESISEWKFSFPKKELVDQDWEWHFFEKM